MSETMRSMAGAKLPAWVTAILIPILGLLWWDKEADLKSLDARQRTIFERVGKIETLQGEANRRLERIELKLDSR